MNAHLPPSRILHPRVFRAALAAALMASPFTAHSQSYTASSNSSTAAITISSGNHTISVGSSGSLTRSNAITLSGGTLQGGIMDNVATVSDLSGNGTASTFVDANGVTIILSGSGTTATTANLTLASGVNVTGANQLLVGGGAGGGGGRNSRTDGGGGGGGFVVLTTGNLSGTLALTAGGGSAGAISGGGATASGGTSSIGATTASGGGGAASSSGTPTGKGGNSGQNISGSSATFTGGNGSSATTSNGGGGGGAGSSENGATGVSSNTGGRGGNGTQITTGVLGLSTYMGSDTFGGGGGGGGDTTRGAGGAGGGGQGAQGGVGGAGTDGLGGGGGGGAAGSGGTGGNGGAGSVAIQYAYDSNVAAGNLTLSGGITLSSTSTLDAVRSGGLIDITTTGISGTGDLNIASSASSGGVVRFSVANTYSGTTTINSGATLQLGNVNALQNSTLDTGTSGSQAVTFTVAGANTYNIGAIQGGDTLDFAANTISIGANNATTSFTGTLAGSGGSLTKAGTGTLTLSNTNTYNGSTTINAGTLQIDGNIANSALVINGNNTIYGTISPGATAVADTFGTSSITINGGRYNWTLNTANGSAGTGYDQITSTGALTSSGLLTVYAYGTPGDWDNGANYSWDIFSANSVSGFSTNNFALDLSNFNNGDGPTGTFTFSNPDGTGIIRLTYTASTGPVWTGGTGNWSTGFSANVTNGETIAFSGTGGIATNNISNGTLTTVNDIEFRNGAGAYTLAANAGSAGASGGMALTVNGSIINNSLNTQTINTGLAFAATRTIDASTGDIAIGGAISGSGGLIKNGSSQLSLTGANTYTGTTTINAGTLQIGNGTTGSLSISSAVVNNANVIYGTTVSTGTSGLSSNITGTGNLTGTAKLLQLNGNITQSGDVSLTSGINGSLYGQGIELVSDTTITAGNITISGDFGRRNAGGGNLTLDTSATNGAITLDVSIARPGDWYGFTSFTANAGTGNLTLTGAYAGSVGWRGGSGANLTGALNISSSFLTVGALNLTATGNSSVTGNLALQAATNTWTVNPGLSMTVSGNLSGTGVAIEKNGTGALILTGSNSYTGGTTLNTGTLVIGNAAAAGTGTITQTNGTSVLTFDTTGTIANSMSIYNVASTQSVTLTGALTAQNTTYDVATGTTLSINGSISGTGGVTKDGDGTLELNAANTFTGDTVVNAGTLKANASGSLASTGNITVTGGSLLVTADNAINDSADMTLAGGTLSFNGSFTETLGSLTLTANSVIDMGGGNIALQFADMVEGLTNTTRLNIYNYTQGSDHIYFRSSANLASSLPYISFYSGIEESSFIGNSFIEDFPSLYEVRPVPEPETWATGLLLLIGGGAWILRKRRNVTAENPEGKSLKTGELRPETRNL